MKLTSLNELEEKGETLKGEWRLSLRYKIVYCYEETAAEAGVTVPW